MDTDTSNTATLEQHDAEEAERRTSVRAKVVHEAIRLDGEEELSRPPSSLAWSGFAAGLAMGFSLLAEGVLRNHLPPADWRPLVAKLGYSLGFLIVILGKQQLFTENTLTPIIPAMHNRDWPTLRKVAKLWTVVFAANIAGAHVIAWFLSSTPVLNPALQQSLLESASEATSVDPWTAFLRGIPAGWLIAMVVWLRAATDAADVAIIGILTYVIAVSGFTHIIAGTVEYVYLVAAGHADWFSFVRDYLVPVLTGNILGGVTIVAALNHAQVVSGSQPS
jgi:formate/nitrite transporter FocA (FNT family)